MKHLFLAALIISTASGAFAKEIVVDKKSGTDLAAAVMSAANGDVVKIQPGIYTINGTITIREKNSIKIIGSGDVQIICEKEYVNVFELENCRDIDITRIRATHRKAEGACLAAVVAIMGGSGIRITECELNGCGTHGVYASGSSNLEISGNTIHHNVYDGIAIEGHGENTVISNNKIHNNGHSGVYLYNASRITLKKNTMTNNGHGTKDNVINNNSKSVKSD